MIKEPADWTGKWQREIRGTFVAPKKGGIQSSRSSASVVGHSFKWALSRRCGVAPGGYPAVGRLSPSSTAVPRAGAQHCNRIAKCAKVCRKCLTSFFINSCSIGCEIPRQSVTIWVRDARAVSPQ